MIDTKTVKIAIYLIKIGIVDVLSTVVHMKLDSVQAVNQLRVIQKIAVN